MKIDLPDDQWTLVAKSLAEHAREHEDMDLTRIALNIMKQQGQKAAAHQVESDLDLIEGRGPASSQPLS